MKNGQFTKIFKVNSVVFPILVFVAYVFSLTESYSYIGSLRKYVLVDSRFFLALALISAVFFIGRKLNALCILTFKANNLIFPVSVILYLMMRILESLHFHNYIFSTYHIQTTNFFYIVFFSLTLFLISKLVKHKIFVSNMSILKLAIIFIFAFAFLDGAVNTLDEAVSTDIYILSHMNASYDFKMEERWGIYYDYIKFVKANTPENASILVPPQASPWGSTGNTALDRYFLYPRALVNGGFIGQTDLEKYDYIMLAWGEEDGIAKDKYGWPKISINAEKVIYFDGDTNAIIVKDGDYDPEISNKLGVWGLIKINK